MSMLILQPFYYLFKQSSQNDKMRNLGSKLVVRQQQQLFRLVHFGTPPPTHMHPPCLNLFLFVFSVRCGTLNSDQSKECECIMEFTLDVFVNNQQYKFDISRKLLLHLSKSQSFGKFEERTSLM